VQQEVGTGTPWAGYGAAVWCFVFAAMSAYWAGGGTAGAGTLGDIVTGIAREPVFLALLWVVAAVKAAGGVFALALAHGRGPRWLLLAGGFGGGALLLAYGVANLGARLVMAVGLIDTPDSMHTPAGRWHLLFWDPWWLLGGALFWAAGLRYRRLAGG
jgi:hypothetical protein